MDRDLALVQFISATDADPDVARQYLEMSNWDADAAVALFLESGGGGGGQGGFSAAVGGQRARAGGNAGFGGSGFAAGDYDMDAGFDAAADDYRAPIEAKVERMVEHGPGAYRGGGPSVQAPVVHRAWRDVEGERKAARGAKAGKASKPKVLSDMMKPPTELLFIGTFDEARQVAKSQQKWLIVNIQALDEFASWMLNRDVWKNEEIAELVQLSFVLWQQELDHEVPDHSAPSNTGKRGGASTAVMTKMRNQHADAFLHRYHLPTTEMPCIAIVDPRAAELVWHHIGSVKPSKMREFLNNWMTDHSWDDHKPITLVRTQGDAMKPQTGFSASSSAAAMGSSAASAAGGFGWSTSTGAGAVSKPNTHRGIFATGTPAASAVIAAADDDAIPVDLMDEDAALAAAIAASMDEGSSVSGSGSAAAGSSSCGVSGVSGSQGSSNSRGAASSNPSALQASSSAGAGSGGASQVIDLDSDEHENRNGAGNTGYSTSKNAVDVHAAAEDDDEDYGFNYEDDDGNIEYVYPGDESRGAASSSRSKLASSKTGSATSSSSSSSSAAEAHAAAGSAGSALLPTGKRPRAGTDAAAAGGYAGPGPSSSSSAAATAAALGPIVPMVYAPLAPMVSSLGASSSSSSAFGNSYSSSGIGSGGSSNSVSSGNAGGEASGRAASAAVDSTTGAPSSSASSAAANEPFLAVVCPPEPPASVDAKLTTRVRIRLPAGQVLTRKLLLSDPVALLYYIVSYHMKVGHPIATAYHTASVSGAAAAAVNNTAGGSNGARPFDLIRPAPKSDSLSSAAEGGGSIGSEGLAMAVINVTTP